MTVFRPARRFPALPLSVGLLLFLPGVLWAGDIVIGMSAAFKGPSRGLGIELYRGSMAYFEHVNRAGGVHGRKIRIRAYDDGYNPLPAIENTVRLIEKDDVFLLYGYVGTPTVTRVLPLLKRYNKRSPYLFFPFTGAQPQRHPPYSEFVFNLRASYRQETAGLVDHFVRIGRKRIAVFYQVDAYGRDGWNGVRLALARHKRKMVGEATYRRGTGYGQSLRAQVDVLRKANPDAVISVGAYAACAAFIRDARDAGWEVPIANVSFVGSENLLGLLQATGKARGKDYTANLINSQVVPSYHNIKLAAVREYRELMDRYKPGPPAAFADKDYQPLPYSFVGFEGFLNAKALVAVLRKMGKDLDKTRLKKAAELLSRLDLGIDVPASFAADKHQGLDRVYFMEVRQGRFVPIQDWQRWKK
jgi:ABC-type branched-subunit amino acid transport system substrate-binding protein